MRHILCTLCSSLLCKSVMAYLRVQTMFFMCNGCVDLAYTALHATMTGSQGLELSDDSLHCGTEGLPVQ